MSICDILNIVSNVTCVSIKDIKGKARILKFKIARQIACYLLRKEGYKYQEIGDMLNKKHSTVIHSVNKIKMLIDNKDKRINDLLIKIKDYETKSIKELVKKRASAECS